jgi:hypothetical protein
MEPGEAVGQNAAVEIVPKGVLYIRGKASSIAGSGVGDLEEGVHVFADDLVKLGVFRIVAPELRRVMTCENLSVNRVDEKRYFK